MCVLCSDSVAWWVSLSRCFVGMWTPNVPVSLFWMLLFHWRYVPWWLSTSTNYRQYYLNLLRMHWLRDGRRQPWQRYLNREMESSVFNVVKNPTAERVAKLTRSLEQFYCVHEIWLLKMELLEEMILAGSTRPCLIHRFSVKTCGDTEAFNPSTMFKQRCAGTSSGVQTCDIMTGHWNSTWLNVILRHSHDHHGKSCRWCVLCKQSVACCQVCYGKVCKKIVACISASPVFWMALWVVACRWHPLCIVSYLVCYMSRCRQTMMLLIV